MIIENMRKKFCEVLNEYKSIAHLCVIKNAELMLALRFG